MRPGIFLAATASPAMLLLMALADYHTHTTLCHHATGSTIDYVKQAHAAGLEEIGFSCHSPMPTPIDDWRMDLADFPRYLEMVEEARNYGDTLGLRVRLGLEVDFCPGHEAWIQELSDMADWDYLIGSVHYIGENLAVDDPRDLPKLKALGLEEVWSRYWQIYSEAAASGLFDFMAHPDLPKKFGHQPPGDLSRFYKPAIDAMVRGDMPFEINTAGLRKPVGEFYPSEAFLELAAEADLALLINSDAHAPEEVGADFEAAVALARRHGFKTLVRFKRRRLRLVPIG